MNSPKQRTWHQNVNQYTLFEFASIKQACPEGIYLGFKPGQPAQWSGVFFVRRGPYAPAILRFQISFPPDYPNLPPSIIFTSDIFHPLVAPLTTYTYTTGSADHNTVSATDEERLPPGGFSLRHGFPDWFGSAQAYTSLLGASSKNPSDYYVAAEHKLRDAIRPPPKDAHSRGSSTRRLTSYSTLQPQHTNIIEVLHYMKGCFDEEKALDILPLDAAGNSGAWKAWQSYRKSTNSIIDTVVSDKGPEQQDEWSWDGVWEERVRKGVDASIAESTLYGGTAAGGEDLIRFIDIDHDLSKDISARIVQSVGDAAPI